MVTMVTVVTVVARVTMATIVADVHCPKPRTYPTVLVPRDNMVTMVTMVTMITMVTIVTDVLNPEPTHCPCGLYLGIAWLPQLLTNDKPT